MSTLKVNKIEATGTTDGGISIDSDGHVQVDGVQLPSAGPLSNRNLVINGAMQIAQRGTENTGQTATAYRCCDRFRSSIGTLGTWTVQQSTDAPDGFTNSLRMLCTAADASPAASDLLIVNYFIEGFDCQRLLDTATTTHPLRLSFWVKAVADAEAFPKTASIDLLQDDNSSKQFSTSYTIQASDTWQRVVIPIPVDTAAAFANDNGRALQINWWLNSGSDYNSGTHSAGWVANDDTARNATNLGVGGTVDDEFCLTGVQLEVGSVATPFEHRSYGDELAKCQRYYQKTNNTPAYTQTPTGTGASAIPMWYSGDTNAHTRFTLPVRMRTPPSASFIGDEGAGSSLQGDHVTGDDGTIGVYYVGAWQSDDDWTFAATETTENSVRMNASGLPRGAAGEAGGLYFYGSASTSTVTLDAEL